MDDTKRQIKPADIQAALAPFFSQKFYANNLPQEIDMPLPHQIRLLPIFSDDPTNISVFYGGSSNVLMLMIGSGFGHWGMAVIRPGSREKYEGNHETASIPWDDGVYFFSQYR